MQVVSLALRKLTHFHLSRLTVVLTLFLAVQLFMSGSTIPIAGLCAGVMPFVCHMTAWPTSPKGTSRIVDALSTYLMGLIFATLFLVCSYGLSMAGLALNPAYAEPHPRMGELYLLGGCASVAFLSATMPTASSLHLSQRMGLGIVLINVELVVLMGAGMLLAANALPDISLYTVLFALLLMALTVAAQLLGSRLEA